MKGTERLKEYITLQVTFAVDNAGQQITPQSFSGEPRSSLMAALLSVTVWRWLMDETAVKETFPSFPREAKARV